MRSKVIKGITYFMLFLMIFSFMAIDSNSIIPFVTGFISACWILLIAVANSKE